MKVDRSNCMMPSWFVKNNGRPYRNWCDVTVCSKCSLTSKYEDQHPVNPCQRCGSKVKEVVGRWVDIHPYWYKPWINKGYWEVKD